MARAVGRQIRWNPIDDCARSRTDLRPTSRHSDGRARRALVSPVSELSKGQCSRRSSSWSSSWQRAIPPPSPLPLPSPSGSVQSGDTAGVTGLLLSPRGMPGGHGTPAGQLRPRTDGGGQDGLTDGGGFRITSTTASPTLSDHRPTSPTDQSVGVGIIRSGPEVSGARGFGPVGRMGARLTGNRSRGTPPVALKTNDPTTSTDSVPNVSPVEMERTGRGTLRGIADKPRPHPEAELSPVSSASPGPLHDHSVTHRVEPGSSVDRPSWSSRSSPPLTRFDWMQFVGVGTSDGSTNSSQGRPRSSGVVTTSLNRAVTGGWDEPRSWGESVGCRPVPGG